MFCKSDSDDTYRPRRFEFGVVRAVAVDIGGASSHVIEAEAPYGVPSEFMALSQQQQSQQPRVMPLVLKR